MVAHLLGLNLGPGTVFLSAGVCSHSLLLPQTSNPVLLEFILGIDLAQRSVDPSVVVGGGPTVVCVCTKRAE